MGRSHAARATPQVRRRRRRRIEFLPIGCQSIDVPPLDFDQASLDLGDADSSAGPRLRAAQLTGGPFVAMNNWGFRDPKL
jgi:hypothetical protein